MNSVTLTGRIVTDIEYGEGGRPHRFRMAFDRKKGEEYVSGFLTVDGWFDADDLGDVLGKGALVIVSGELDFFTTKDGNQVITLLAREVGRAVKYRARGDSGGRGNGRSNGRSQSNGRSGGRTATRSRSADLDESF